MGRPLGSKNRLQLSQLSDADATAMRGMALRGQLPTKKQLGRMQEIADYMAGRNRAEKFLSKDEAASIAAETRLLGALLSYTLPPLAMIRVNQSDMDEKLANSGIVVLPALSVTDGQGHKDTKPAIKVASIPASPGNGHDTCDE